MNKKLESILLWDGEGRKVCIGKRWSTLALPLLFLMGKHTFSKKKKVFVAKSLAQKIGYLKIQVPDLPIQTFSTHKIIRPKNELLVIQKGTVEIWHTREDILITELGESSAFGEMSLLGQTMLGTQAIAGSGGVTLGVMDLDRVTEWVNSNQLSILQVLGPHLAQIEVEHYRTQFQTTDSRLAALLLDLAGEGEIITGVIHGDLSDQLGTYRETVTQVIQQMKKNKLVELGRKKITILSKKGLRELSEL